MQKGRRGAMPPSGMWPYAALCPAQRKLRLPAKVYNVRGHTCKFPCGPLIIIKCALPCVKRTIETFTKVSKPILGKTFSDIAQASTKAVCYYILKFN